MTALEALKQLRDSLKYHAVAQVVQLEASDVKKMLELVDAALVDLALPEMQCLNCGEVFDPTPGEQNQICGSCTP